jgi:hypothetical protein
VAFLWLAGAAWSTDLTKIDRSLSKEPVYKTNSPEYCLLVFGPEAKTKVWLVRDGDTLYLDRNGNGDLTEPGEKVAADRENSKPEENVYSFKAGDIPDGKRLHKDLSVHFIKLDEFADSEEAVQALLKKNPQARGYMVAIEMEMPGLQGRGTGGRVVQQAVFADYRGLLRFASQPSAAPIIHFGGPLQITLWGARRLQIGRQADVTLGVASPGVGPGTSAYVFYEGVIPRTAYPKLEVAYPPQRPGEKPIRQTYELKGRC